MLMQGYRASFVTVIFTVVVIALLALETPVQLEQSSAIKPKKHGPYLSQTCQKFKTLQ